MALTKQDLKSIGGVVDKKLDTRFKEFGKRIDLILDDKLDEKFVDHLSFLEKRLDKRMDKRFDEVNEKFKKIDERFDRIDERLEKVEEFTEFAKPALEALLEESQQSFEQKIPQRVSTLENLHLGTHTHVN